MGVIQSQKKKSVTLRQTDRVTERERMNNCQMVEILHERGLEVVNHVWDQMMHVGMQKKICVFLINFSSQA